MRAGSGTGNENHLTYYCNMSDIRTDYILVYEVKNTSITEIFF